MKDEKRNAAGRLKSLWLLFINMLKIGLFTFGGGYAMIHLLENEFVSKKKWIEEDEFMDLVAIAESTPGPIAINCSTYIGYKKEKIVGAVLATLGMCIPSFTIIFLISLFFNQFLSIDWVASAFKGIQVCVVFLILSAGVKMLKKMKKKPFNLIVMSATFLCMVAFGVFAVSFSSIFYILISGFVGLLIYLIGYFKSKKSPEKKEDEQ
ncbi:MAG: chromate transporter [Clostridia bacterium]|nr:chromate transporter [Clostridia bacterium]